MLFKRLLVAAILAHTVSFGCGSSRDASQEVGGAEGSEGDPEPEPPAQPERFDVGGGDGSGLPVGCAGDSDCELIDLLLVVDNSATMAEEQRNLAANFQSLVEQLTSLDGADGRVKADVNVMVTTTDLGHPLCAEHQRDGYVPAAGAPVYTGCNERIASFSSLDPDDPTVDPDAIVEACTRWCPVDVVPGGDPFVHFDPMTSNVPSGDVAAALSCVAPQGVDGCGYEAPLEAMLQALRPDACWNDPSQARCDADETWDWVSHGFLRPGSTLAIAIITDEYDCSIRSPEGYEAFLESDPRAPWGVRPDTGEPEPSSAVCWRAGVSCSASGSGDAYESCVPQDAGVLHPVSRYVEFLRYLGDQFGHDIVMLGILGVPPVTERRAVPPYDAVAGGLDDLVFRDWRDGEYDPGGDGDILPAQWAVGVTAADKQWEFGIGPGCTGQTSEPGVFTGQAMPPVRIREVCRSLDSVDARTGLPRRRCCIESICDQSFAGAIECLAGVIQETVNPAK